MVGTHLANFLSGDRPGIDMRERIIDRLIDSEYIEVDASKREFLVYLMGPYTSFPPYATPQDRDGVPTERGTLDELLEPSRNDVDLSWDEALGLLVHLKRDLREQTGVNAFLATDPEIPLHELDAATQSIEHTRAADLTVVIAPAMGDNLGVGIETGSVCEHLDQPDLLTDVVFLGESAVDSTMVDAVSARWHVTVDDFDSYALLEKTIRAHIRRVI